jgi:hypothetical protein
MRTEESKLGLYIDWFPLTARFNQKTKLLEYYDYDTPDGVLELVNTANRNNKAQADEMDELLETQIIPNELRAPLPARLRPAQTIAREEYLLYKEFLDLLPAGEWQKGALRDIVGFGAEF